LSFARGSGQVAREGREGRSASSEALRPVGWVLSRGLAIFAREAVDDERRARCQRQCGDGGAQEGQDGAPPAPRAIVADLRLDPAAAANRQVANVGGANAAS